MEDPDAEDLVGMYPTSGAAQRQELPRVKTSSTRCRGLGPLASLRTGAVPPVSPGSLSRPGRGSQAPGAGVTCAQRRTRLQKEQQEQDSLGSAESTSCSVVVSLLLPISSTQGAWGAGGCAELGGLGTARASWRFAARRSVSWAWVPGRSYSKVQQQRLRVHAERPWRLG